MAKHFRSQHFDIKSHMINFRVDKHANLAGFLYSQAIPTKIVTIHKRLVSHKNEVLSCES